MPPAELPSLEPELAEVVSLVRDMLQGRLEVELSARTIVQNNLDEVKRELSEVKAKAKADAKKAKDELDAVKADAERAKADAQKAKDHATKIVTETQKQSEADVREAKALALVASTHAHQIVTDARSECKDQVQAVKAKAEAEAKKAKDELDAVKAECSELKFKLECAKVQIDQLKNAMDGAEVMREEDAFGAVDQDETQITRSPHNTLFEGGRSMTPPSPVLGYRNTGGPAGGGAGGGSAGATIVITDDSLSRSSSTGAELKGQGGASAGGSVVDPVVVSRNITGSKPKVNRRAPGERAAKRFQYTHMRKAWNSFYNNSTSGSAWDLFVDKFVKAATHLEQRHLDLSHLHSIEFSHDFETDLCTILGVRGSMKEARNANDKSVSGNFLKDSIMVQHLAAMKRVHEILQDSRPDSKKNRASKKPASSASKEPASSASKEPASSASTNPSGGSYPVQRPAHTDPEVGSSAEKLVVTRRGLGKLVRNANETESDSSCDSNIARGSSDADNGSGGESD